MPDEGSLPVGQPKPLLGKGFPSGKDSSVGGRLRGLPLNDSCRESSLTPVNNNLSNQLPIAVCGLHGLNIPERWPRALPAKQQFSWMSTNL